MSQTTTLTINGTTHHVDRTAHPSLLGFLRNALHVTSAKQGCDLGQCGACTVMLNGVATQSCQVSLGAADGAEIQTLEAILDTPLGRALTQALIREDAAQCGYCLPGIVMAAYGAALSEPVPKVADALAQNLCRCGSHTRILRALTEAFHSQETDR